MSQASLPRLTGFAMTSSERPAADPVGRYLDVLAQLGVIRSQRTTRALLGDLFGGIDFRNRRVLDIGGGDGVYSFYAGIRGAREVLCLEPEADGSDGCITGAFQRMQAALPDLPVRMERKLVQQHHDVEGYDVIIMNASINHIDEDACARLHRDARAQQIFRGVFAHIARLARPGGRLVVTDCSRRNFFAALGLTNPLCPTIEWHKHQPPAVWARLLEESGFALPRIRWEPLYRFGRAGERLLGNRYAAYFLKSMFRLEMLKI